VHTPTDRDYIRALIDLQLKEFAWEETKTTITVVGGPHYVFDQQGKLKEVVINGKSCGNEEVKK